MRVDFPGVMMPFSQVAAGDCLLFFTEGAQMPDVGMKVSVGGSDAVLSFTTPVHPSMTPPTVLYGFENKQLCVLRDATVRPKYDANGVWCGSPSINRPGPIIFANRVTFIRAWGANLPGSGRTCSRRGPLALTIYVRTRPDLPPLNLSEFVAVHESGYGR
jgi:hypothetical protein